MLRLEILSAMAICTSCEITLWYFVIRSLVIKKHVYSSIKDMNDSTESCINMGCKSVPEDNFPNRMTYLITVLLSFEVTEHFSTSLKL